MVGVGNSKDPVIPSVHSLGNMAGRLQLGRVKIFLLVVAMGIF